MRDQPYHHGELRRALVDAALEVLERDGPAGLSLRGLARAVGVSPMAPYHHFADRAALLAAVAAAGFDRLQQRKVAVEGASGSSVRAALVAGTVSYVAFVLEHPHLHRLMKAAEFADRAPYPELQRAAAAPANQLLSLIERLSFNKRGSSPDRYARMLWSLAHGIATLALDRQIPAAEAGELARDAATAMIDGWLCPAETGEPMSPRAP